MPDKTHIARVTLSFEFLGVLPVGEYADPEKAVRERFKFINADVRGFVEQKRSLAVRTEEISVPELP